MTNILNWLKLPLPKKIISLKYNYSSFYFKIFPDSFLVARLPWGKLKVYNNWTGRSIYQGTYDTVELNCIKNIIMPDWVIFDIGANIGLYTLFFSNFASLIYGFEPSKKEFGKLEDNLRINSVNNASVYNFGFGNKNGEVSFFLSNNPGQNTMYPEETKPYDKITIELKKVDDFVESNKIDKIDFLKIDVEGAEMDVLKGAKNSISQFKPVLFIEVWDFFNKRISEKDDSKVVNYLLAEGYNIYIIDDSSSLVKIEANTVIKSNNLLFVHKSMNI